LTGVAVNVTTAPSHTVPEGLAEIFTLAATVGFTISVITFERVGEFVMQGAFDAIQHFTKLPFASVQFE
jgi:hypothetical protein